MPIYVSLLSNNNNVAQTIRLNEILGGLAVITLLLVSFIVNNKNDSTLLWLIVVGTTKRKQYIIKVQRVFIVQLDRIGQSLSESSKKKSYH